MRISLLVLTLAFSAAACTHHNARQQEINRGNEVKASKAGASGVRRTTTNKTVPYSNVNADNTKVNKVDATGDTLTPTNQSNAPSDVAIAARIRQGLVHNDALSVDAKNVKIIVVDGVVTLRGPVKSEGERTQVLSAAERVAGGDKVRSELNVIGH